MNMRDVARYAQSAAHDAAQRHRAFDSGEIAALSDSGAMDLAVGGATTLLRKVGDGSVSRWRKVVGDAVLIVRIDRSKVSLGRSPFQDGDVTVSEHNFNH